MKKIQALCVLAGLMLLLAACGQPQVVTETVEVLKEVEVEKIVEIEIEMEPQLAVDGDTAEISNFSQVDGANTSVSLAEEQGASTLQRNRLIIKDGDIAVTVEDTGRALDSVGQLVTATGGYIIDQKVYKLDEYNYVTMQIGVPVSEFERAMVALRKLGNVTQDSASGVDVTDEFVDLESRLGNLKVKQERLRTFMTEAKKIEDVLKVEAELSDVEEELNVIQGRINYLKDRSSFSTISIQIDPWVPTATPSPTPTMTPTSTPTAIPTPNSWRPGDTAQIATVELQQTSQSVANGIIYLGIICGPWLLLLLLAGWGVYAFNRRFGNGWEFPLPNRLPERTVRPTEIEDIEQNRDSE